MTYYIDPGTTKGCAVACFSGAAFLSERKGMGELRGLGFWDATDGIRPDRWWGLHGHGGAVWEMPQLYPPRPGARRAKVRAGGRPGPSYAGARARSSADVELVAKGNDLIRLSAAGAACANVLGWGRGGVRSVLPREWKKQIAKPQHHLRVFKVLTEPEIELVVQAWHSTHGRGVATKSDMLAHWVDLFAYVEKAARWVGANPGKPLQGYSAQITDLLDAVALGLTEEGRLVI